MAYVNGNRRISPLDINKNVTIGVAFPLDDVNMFKGTQTLKEQVKSNLINLLLTEPGERVIISYSFNLDGSSDVIQLNFNSSYFPRGNG